jgi:uncharacterized protein HemX
MALEEVREAMRQNSIDQVLAHTKHMDREDLDEAVQLYERYYEKEFNITKTIQDILAQIKIRRAKNKIPNLGNYSYELES